jgi:two-component system, cell cycle sensor histidine kinase and response regulator CckA
MVTVGAREVGVGGEPSDAGRVRAADRGLAHDLRNLLTAIDGHAQLARAALAHDHPAHEDLDEVLAATSRAHQLTQAWLDGSGNGASTGVPVVPVPLDDLVRGFLPLLDAVIGPTVEVEVHLDAPRPVRVSALRLERVLLNLCLNARDAMPDGGRLTIATTDGPDGLGTVAVTDTGPGIDPAVVERLFDPDGPPPAGAGGHGLGLATSRLLLQETGGSLEVESRPGVGTTLRARLPGA